MELHCQGLKERLTQPQGSGATEGNELGKPGTSKTLPEVQHVKG